MIHQCRVNADRENQVSHIYLVLIQSLETKRLLKFETKNPLADQIPVTYHSVLPILLTSEFFI